jgi:integrase
VRVADGQGGNRIRNVGTADDFEAADGEHILDYGQAIEHARRYARTGRTDTGSGGPATVRDAINAYERDLLFRGASPVNASRLRPHTVPIAGMLVGELTAKGLVTWRGSLTKAGMKQATLVRTCRVLKAALNLAADADERILNRSAWRKGLGRIAENYVSRNDQALSEEQVLTLVAASYEVDPAFGRLIEVAATTGARMSQIARLTVGDLQDGANPRLLMPASRKGHKRQAGKTPLPISAELAEKLATNRPSGEPLLLRSNGHAWRPTRDDQAQPFALAAERAGISGITMYALRHSSIVRMLRRGVHTRIVAAAHDTSVGQIEKTYSAYITDHADDILRGALLGGA